MRKTFIYTVLLVATGLSCSTLRLDRPVTTGTHDWLMYGGRMERTNATENAVVPPLSRAWTYDASSGFSPYSIALADSLLIIQNLQGEIRIVSAPDGRELGSRRFGTSVFGTPVLHDDTLYVALSRDATTVLAYNLRSAVIQWKLSAGDVETSPLLMQNRLFVTTYEGKLLCISTSTGEILWTYKVPESSQPALIRSSPAGDGETVFFGCDDHKLYAVNAADGSLRWSAATRGSIVATPSVADDKIFVGSLDSSLHAFNRSSGTLVWQRDLGSRIFGSQAVKNGYVYAGSTGGDLFCLDAKTGTLVWTCYLNSILNAAPLVSDTVVYVGCGDKKMYAVSAATGSLLWSSELPGRVRGTPVAWNGFLFVLDDTHTVTAFRQK